MKRKAKADTIPADHLMIIAAFRYCLGRQTYIVAHCRDWLSDNWHSIPENTRGIIQRDLEEAFADDDNSRAAGEKHHRLGMDFDRGAWAHIRRLYRRPSCCQCGKAELADENISIVHLDGEVSCKACYDHTCMVCRKKFNTGDTFVPVGRKARHPGCGEVPYDMAPTDPHHGGKISS